MSSNVAAEGAVADEPADLVVIGGGIAGLVAARRAALAGARVCLLESSDRLGGMLRRSRIAGDIGDIGIGIDVEIDIGAEAFAVRGGTVARFLSEFGLDDDIVEPQARGSWGYADGAAYPLPKTGLLGIPAHPAAPDVRAAIGVAGASRATHDAALTPDTGTRTHSLGDLVRTRMGDAVVDRLVAPVARGVYSTDPDLLDHRRLVPGLADRIATAGTLGLAVAELRAAAPPGAAVRGLRGGMWRLVDALEGELRRLGVDVRTGARVVGVHGTSEGSRRVEFAAGASAGAGARSGSIDARGVLLTIDPASGIAVDGLTGPGADSDGPAARDSGGARAPVTPAEVVALMVEAPELDAFPRGTGVLVGDPPGDVAAKALTHVTAKWSWLADALRPGWHVIRLSYGPARAARRRRAPGNTASDEPLTRDLDDDVLADLALRDASTLLDVPLARGQLRGLARHEWSIPHPATRIGRAETLDLTRERAQRLDGLALAGTWIDGTGLATVIPGAEHAADSLVAR